MFLFLLKILKYLSFFFNKSFRIMFNFFFFFFFNFKFKKLKFNYFNFYSKFNKFLFNSNFIKLDFLLLKTYYLLKNFNINFIFRFFFRLNNVSWNFYNRNIKDYFNTFINNYFIGLKFLWSSFNYWFISIFLFFIIIYYLLYIKTIIFNKVLFEWFLLTMLLYWLMSGFVFFIKKYQFSKFTSVIQRFWKRSFILFWMIEGGVFVVFFFLTLNATEEPVYMYDQMKLFKDHLFSWRLFLIKLMPNLGMIFCAFFLKNIIKWNMFSKHVILILIITFLFLFILWLEFYQFFHIINFYSNLSWNFDYEEFMWNLDIDYRRTRIVNNLTMICFLAKFWHVVFIFFFWIFFVLRVNEINRIRHMLLSSNIQNFIIMYILTWLYMFPWLKFLIKNFMDLPYFWFLLNSRDLGIRIFFNDIKLFYFSITHFQFKPFKLFMDVMGWNYDPFVYWIESSVVTGFEQFRKHFLKDLIISSFVS